MRYLIILHIFLVMPQIFKAQTIKKISVDPVGPSVLGTPQPTVVENPIHDVYGLYASWPAIAHATSYTAKLYSDNTYTTVLQSTDVNTPNAGWPNLDDQTDYFVGIVAHGNGYIDSNEGRAGGYALLTSYSGYGAFPVGESDIFDGQFTVRAPFGSTSLVFDFSTVSTFENFWIAVRQDQPGFTQTNDGTFDEPIGAGQTFQIRGIVGTYKIYGTGGVTLLPNPVTFK